MSKLDSRRPVTAFANACKTCSLNSSKRPVDSTSACDKEHTNRV